MEARSVVAEQGLAHIYIIAQQQKTSKDLSNGIFTVVLVRVIHLQGQGKGKQAVANTCECGTYLPAGCREYMLVPLVPTSLDHLPGVGLVLFDGGVSQKTHVVVDVKIEQWAGLPAGLIHDEVVEGVMLRNDVSTKTGIHEVI